MTIAFHLEIRIRITVLADEENKSSSSVICFNVETQ